MLFHNRLNPNISTLKAFLFMSKLYIMIIFFFPAFVLSEQLVNCGNNEEARSLFKLITEDTGQKRSVIRCNKILTDAAEAKAQKMLDFGLVTHNLGGSPNSHLVASGYKLPSHYGYEYNSNQVEAIAGGYSNANEVWDAFKRSEGHRTHLLGEHEFYIEQDEIGIGFVKNWNSPHVEYWVVYLTKGYQKNQSYSGEIPNKSLFIIEKSKEK